MRVTNFGPWGPFRLNLVRLGLVLGTAVAAVPARAEDDLLKILDGEAAPAQNEAVAKTASELRPLVADEGAEARVFIGHVENGDFERAFFHWPVAFGGKSFAATPSGRALYGLLLFKNGLAINGIETLMAVETPAEIAAPVIRLWKEAAGDQHQAWSFVRVAWTPEWTGIFGVAAEVRVISRALYGAEQSDALRELIKKTTVGTRERAALQWQLALALALGDKAGEAAQVLSLLMKAPNNPVSPDLMTMTAARLLFQNGYLDAAAQYYSKIPKSSDHWIDAQEELAWTEMRRARPQNVLAITQTLVQPAFNGQTGPESHFLRSLAQLKVCDYPGAVESLKTFRARFRPRSAELLALQENAATPAVDRFMKGARDRQLKMADLKADVHALPRMITRDAALLDLVRSGAALGEEGKAAEALFLRSMGYEALQPGARAHIAEAQKRIDARVRAAQSAVYAAVKQLAEDEVREISDQLRKLHIVEAEILQQIAVAEKRIIATRAERPSERRGTTGSAAKDTIWFPAEKEIWFDELANFKVDIKKGCQAKAPSASRKAM